VFISLTPISKHTGLEKAVHQIEQALKRSGFGNEQIQSLEQATELRYLLEKSRDLLANRTGAEDYASFKADEHDQRSSPNWTSASLDTPPQAPDDGLGQRIDEDQLSLDDAENPLQLLARTSELLSAIQPRVANPANTAAAISKPQHRDDHDLQKFFGPYRPRLDVGEELDPIELGLMTPAEAEALFS
jgi:hypothetical protein